MQEVLSKKGTFLFTAESSFDALYLARAFLEVLLDSVPSLLRFPLEDQMIFYRVAKEWPLNKFVKYAKYVTAWPMAKFLNNPLPERPEGFHGNPLFSGKVKRLLKSRIVSKSDRNARLFFGILQGVKRGAAVVPESFISESMAKHREALTQRPRGSEPDEDFHLRYSEFFDEFKAPKPKLFEASSSASFQSKRSEGGSREWIRNNLQTGQIFRPDELIRMVEVRPGHVEEVRGVNAPSFPEALALAKAGSRNVTVSAVLEPLKVRLITKGDSFRYWLSRFYQKALWKYLQTFPQFVLTGRPLEIGDLLDLKERERNLGLNLPNWVSGDYSAATDSLDIRHTKAAFESSLRSSLAAGHFDTVDVLRSVLYEQKLHYPSKFNLDPVEQTTGQLMGSTLSFPILCAVNIVAYWRAMEQYLGKSVEIRDLPVLINGDDILFRSDHRLYDLWRDSIKEVGFELSLGKNYVHPVYLTVNSQLYSDRGGHLTHLGVLNAGLLTGQSKVTGRRNAKLAPIWDYYNEVVPAAVNPLRAHRRFLHYHKKTIDVLTGKGNYNLFLPFERGGLGFKPFPGLKFKVTSFQRRYATYLESLFISDPSVTNKIGLVSGTNRSDLILWHRPRWTIGPKIGPQPLGVIEPEDQVVSLPPLALENFESERPELRVRLPRPRVIRTFRTGTFKRMGGEITSFPFKALELDLRRRPSESEVDFVQRVGIKPDDVVTFYPTFA
jgi:hypothetical protein